jgi:putative FmdB family regulatory protein
MPLYEYLCASCGHRFERIQKFSDPPVAECPACGGAVAKQVSSPAIQFKGSGWYITDYAKSGKDKNKDKDTSKADPSDKPGDKPAAPAANASTSESSSKSTESSKPAPAATPAGPDK